MKGKFLIVLFTIIICCYISDSFAEKEKNENYKKDFAIGIDPIQSVFLGRALYAEVSSLGAIGIYGAHYNVGGLLSLMGELFDKDISGYAVEAGLKYYINYQSSYHDSYYIAAGYRNTFLEEKDRDDSEDYVELRGHSGFFYLGRRWQWSVVFLDLSLGIGYTKVKTKVGTSYNQENVDDLEEDFGGHSREFRCVIGIAF